jgi:hypothetical protein
MTEISLENADRRTGWRPSIIKSAGEPVFGAVSSELFGSLHPPSGFGYCPASHSLFGRRPSAASLKAEKMLPSRPPRRPKAIAASMWPIRR